MRTPLSTVLPVLVTAASSACSPGGATTSDDATSTSSTSSTAMTSGTQQETTGAPSTGTSGASTDASTVTTSADTTDADTGGQSSTGPLMCTPPPKVGGSADMPEIRDVAFVGLPLTDVVGGPNGYHIGVDVWIGDYVPGHHAEDPYYGACVMAHVGPLSYYKVYNPGEYPSGIFVDNENPNACLNCGDADPCAQWCDRCTDVMHHDWARKITGAALEIYAHDADRGGVRLDIEGFDNFANGGVYGPELGVVTLPTFGAPGVAKLNGFVYTTSGGPTAAAGRFTLDVFHQGPAGETSSGYPMLGFGSTSTNADGYYNPGPLLYGTYKTYLTDNETQQKVVVYLDVTQPDLYVEFILDEPCFGQPKCDPP